MCRHCGVTWPGREPREPCESAAALRKTLGRYVDIAELLQKCEHAVEERHSTRVLEDLCARCKKSYTARWERVDAKAPVKEPVETPDRSTSE